MQTCICGHQNRNNARFCGRCGRPFGASPGSTHLQPGTRLYYRYVIIHLLKQGGMGAIYLANDMHLVNQVCVLKELLDRFLDPQQQTRSTDV